MRLIWLLAVAGCCFGQTAPRFEARDVRPQGSAETHPLLPKTGVWIFGQNLGPHCGVTNMMDPATYQTELCGVRVLFGGIEARLLYTSPTQINLIAPDHPWENEMVNVQVVNHDGASAVVPVRFGVNRPVLSLAEPAFAGMPVWLQVDTPWGKRWLRYPHWTEPWDIGPGKFEVRFEGKEVPMRDLLPHPPLLMGKMVGLPHDVPAKYLGRAPLHLLFAFDRPGTYEIRYSDRDLVSEWTPIEVRPSTPAQRGAWLLQTIASAPSDVVDLLCDYLPNLLASHDEAALRVLARYLDAPDQVLRYYAGYALHYFAPALRERVVPGRQPMQGGIL